MSSVQNKFNPDLALELIHLIDRAYEYYEIFDENLKDKSHPPTPKEIADIEKDESLKIHNWITNDPQLLLSSESYHCYSENFDIPHLPIPSDFTDREITKYKIIEKFFIAGKNQCEIISKTVGEESTFFGFVLEREDNNTIYVVFRGTRENTEWIQNCDFAQTDFNGAKVSQGFKQVYAEKKEGQSIREILRTTLNDRKIDCQPPTRVIVTGHSLGGALASLATADIQSTFGIRPILYTFASPRVGDLAFKENIERNSQVCYRIFNTEDMVPQIPLPNFVLQGIEMKSNSIDTKYKTDVLEYNYGSIVDKIYEYIQVSVNELKTIPESTRDEVKNVKMLMNVIASLWTGKKNGEKYAHIGKPVCFTRCNGAISSDHNLYTTYRNALILKELSPPI